MTKKNILHMISPQGNVSPFDVNMACDAGYDLVIPYTNVKKKAEEYKSRFGVDIIPADGTTDELNSS